MAHDATCHFQRISCHFRQYCLALTFTKWPKAADFRRNRLVATAAEFMLPVLMSWLRQHLESKKKTEMLKKLQS